MKKRDRGGAEASRHIEVWGELAAACRFWQLLSAACVALAFIGLAVGAYGGLVALREPLVFAVDQGGQALALGPRGSLTEPVEAEVRHVTKRFLQASLGYHSDTIERDLAESFNWMTAELQRRTEAELEAFAAARGESLAALVKRQRIRTEVEFSSVEVARRSDTHWSVRVTGRLKTWPLGQADRPSSERAYDATLVLVRVPRTEETPNGLLVSSSARQLRELSVLDERSQATQPR
jgi:type IV secretory pathway TrbF-like protein